MAAEIPDSFIDALRDVTGDAGCVTSPGELAPHLVEWRGLYRGHTPLMVAPATTQEAAAILRLCFGQRVGVVPQGGNTGLVGGAIPNSGPAHPQILLATRRLNRVRELDAENYTITAEAGCILSDVHAAAASEQRLFPLSLAAEGSCRLGGNLSTNAGGTNVLRYGNARDLVLGLEVVLPDGRIFDGLRGLRKDNTGYDLKQLFIGAEGTLGLITAATCKLFPQPRSTATAFVAVASPAAAVSLYSRARQALGDQLNAFELIGRSALDFVFEQIPGARDPLDDRHDWYVLLELGAADGDADADMEAFLADAMTEGRVADGVTAQSNAQRDALWALRHDISEAEKKAGAGIKHDISVPVSCVAGFIRQASVEAIRLVPGAHVVAFGHLGDGNIHFNLNQPDEMSADAFLERWEPVSERIHEIADALGGSFSAEHGVGTLKRAALERWRGGVELELMQTLKAAFDPRGIMNPGKVLRHR